MDVVIAAALPPMGDAAADQMRPTLPDRRTRTSRRNRLCVGSTCVTEAEFKALLEKDAISPVAPDPSPTPTPAQPSGDDDEVVATSTLSGDETATSTDAIDAPPLVPEYNDASRPFRAFIEEIAGQVVVDRPDLANDLPALGDEVLLRLRNRKGRR